MTPLMRVSIRTTVAAILVVLVLTAGVQVFGRSACADGCDEGEGAACADCPLCSPARAAALLRSPDGPSAGPAGAYESLPAFNVSRTEDRGVFHVPRHLV